jgi:hypothetical protein
MPENHRAFQIYLLGFFKAYTYMLRKMIAYIRYHFSKYTCGMIGSDSDLPTPDDSHKMSTIEISGDEVRRVRFSGLRRQQRTRPGRNYTSYFAVGFGCQSSFDIPF